MDKKGVLGLFPVYDEKEKEWDMKACVGVKEAFQRSVWFEDSEVPLPLLEKMMDQGIAVLLVVKPERVKFFQQKMGESRHVYVAIERRKDVTVDKVIETMLKKMKADGVVRALV